MRLIFQVKPAKTIFHIFFHSHILKLSDLNFLGFFMFIWAIIITLITSVLDGLLVFSQKKLLLWRSITSNVYEARKQKFYSSWYFLSRFFFWRPTRHAGSEGIIFSPLISSYSRTFKQFFTVFSLRWLPSIFDDNLCNC